MPTYSCAEVSTYRNIYGGYSCKEWVEQSQITTSVAQPSQFGLSLNQEDASIVGVWLVKVFIVFVCYAIIVKAIKKA